MAAVAKRLTSTLSLSRRALNTTAAVNAKAKGSEDPVKALFIEKLKEFKSKKNVCCVEQSLIIPLCI